VIKQDFTLELWCKMGEERKEIFERAKDYVRGNEAELRAKYGEDYLAIVDGEVIDNASDEFELARRMKKPPYRGRPILVTNIENVINPVVNELPSPEREEMAGG